MPGYHLFLRLLGLPGLLDLGPPSPIDPAPAIRLAGIVLVGLLYWRAYKSPPIKYGG